VCPLQYTTIAAATAGSVGCGVVLLKLSLEDQSPNKSKGLVELTDFGNFVDFLRVGAILSTLSSCLPRACATRPDSRYCATHRCTVRYGMPAACATDCNDWFCSR